MGVPSGIIMAALASLVLAACGGTAQKVTTPQRPPPVKVGPDPSPPQVRPEITVRASAHCVPANPFRVHRSRVMKAYVACVEQQLYGVYGRTFSVAQTSQFDSCTMDAIGHHPSKPVLRTSLVGCLDKVGADIYVRDLSAEYYGPEAYGAKRLGLSEKQANGPMGYMGTPGDEN